MLWQTTVHYVHMLLLRLPSLPVCHWPPPFPTVPLVEVAHEEAPVALLRVLLNVLLNVGMRVGILLKVVLPTLLVVDIHVDTHVDIQVHVVSRSFCHGTKQFKQTM